MELPEDPRGLPSAPERGEGGRGEEARLRLRAEADVLDVVVGGPWRLEDGVPALELPEGARPRVVRVRPEGLGRWDTSLVLLVLRAREAALERGAELDVSELPEGLQELLQRMEGAGGAGEAAPRPGIAERVGRATIGAGRGGLDFLRFVGETALTAFAALRRPTRVQWRDLSSVVQASGPGALPIVGGVSLLVGVIVAYQGAIQLRGFGADVYIANLVVLSVVREMGPVMTAVILAGRTGTAFAAHIGNMVVNEEVDALQTLGISPVGFLVLPRVLALVLVTPLLTIYADALGIVGGAMVSSSVLGIPTETFVVQAQGATALWDVGVGLVKSVAFGLLVALAGCFQGLRCQRTSAAIGKAATSAAVVGILLVVAADALFGEIFARFGV